MRTTRLVIFARYPTPGRAKTRLVPELGESGAARLQDAMTRQTLREATAFARRHPANVEVRFTGAAAATMAGRYGTGLSYVSQGDGGLGERLLSAAADAFHAGQAAAILIGTDCPALTAATLARAADALAAGSDLVVGPAADGGYYLLGTRRLVPALFDGIDWGTSRVLAQTLAAADRLALSRVLLPTLGDVDVPADLPACRAALPPEPPPYAPQRIAITGATGCLGRHFLERVAAALPKTRVTALVRRESKGFAGAGFQRIIDALGDRLTLVDGDLRRPITSRADRRALAESDGGLWHFAACTNLHPTAPAAARETREVNEHGTARLLELLAASGRPGPVLYTSTAYVCGGRRGTVFEHELDAGLGHGNDLTFRNGYERSKHAAETLVRAAFDAGLSGVVLRPSLVVASACGAGPGDVVDVLGAAFALAAARHGRRLDLPMPATAAVNAVPVDWVVRIMLAVANRTADRATYHLTAPAETTVADATRAAESVYGPLDVRFDAPADRLFRRAMLPFRPYFDVGVRFDRANLELDVDDVTTGATLDLPPVLRLRARAPLPPLRHAPLHPHHAPPGTPPAPAAAG